MLLAWVLNVSGNVGAIIWMESLDVAVSQGPILL